MRTSKSFRARKREHLTPLLYLPTWETMAAIDEMKPRKLRALLRVMAELNQFNCWWAEYQFAEIFRCRVIAQLGMATEKRRTN
ncbi:hypothetical protein BXT89_14250 [Halopseudomonas pachastrellae]|uniref:Uncharacterized protein n=1 Tax=Halopseudomonas pachastrellae TaxID=254161 RepID=A0A1S8DCI6_9GAMM|nr:hypothetical protein [Halopseudomonas pachastrellae]ONM43113.1 hypothetical protein BXT89_14250 [Halopseudomonas pachastrellae]SFL70562.1 hypothetical protein SAMN05216256_10169 [Halopseudomonas pachastrellae]